MLRARTRDGYSESESDDSLDGDNGSGGGLSPTSLPSLRRFVVAHSTNVGAHPFLAGLARCLREQLGDNRCAIWTMEDEVLTQAGPGFAEAAVTVLVDGQEHKLQEYQLKHDLPERRRRNRDQDDGDL